MKTENSKRDKFLKEHYLTGFHNQFLRLSGLNGKQKNKKVLNEWSFLPNSLEEDGEDDNDMNNNGNAPMGGDPNMPPMGNDNSAPMGNDMGGGLPGQDGVNQPPMDGGAPDSQAPMGDNGGQAPIPSPTPMDNAPMPNEEDDADELDITDLTDAQEEMNKKINAVGKEASNTQDTVSQLMAALNKINDIIDSNNAKIEDLKKEIQKRNPTPLEKLDLRAVDSSKPYNIRPNDFWGNKLDELPNYDVYNEADPNKTEKEYVITTDDINDTNSTEIEKSFRDLDLDLEKIFGLK